MHHLSKFVRIGLLLINPSVATAGATENTRWQWAGQERRYHLKTQVAFIKPFPLLQERNGGGQMTALGMDVVVRCRQVGVVGKTTMSLVCKTEDASLQAIPYRRIDEGKLVGPLQEYDDRWTGSDVELSLKPWGRVTRFDPQFEKMTSADRGLDAYFEMIDENLGKYLFQCFDHELPKTDSDLAAGTWKQTSNLLNVPTRIIHDVETTAGSLIKARTRLSRPSGAFALSGEYTFDAANGTVISSHQEIEIYRNSPMNWTSPQSYQHIDISHFDLRVWSTCQLLDANDVVSMGQTREVSQFLPLK
jgi:hypothetical protein